MINLLTKIFGSPNERHLRRLRPLIPKINALELSYQSLTDEQLKAKTTEFKERFQRGETLDSLLPEAFAAVKNGCRRLCGQQITYMGKTEAWNMVPFDVQLLGGMVIHFGGIAEMQTGEGKTLTASLPLYLNALSGRNCQLVTTNDYLARRDSEWIGTIFRYLGLTVGCIQNDQHPALRREQYACDITYGTNSEFGFDYLRDQGMSSSKAELVQRDHFFVIVDEIDSILIDEARTPLIISGPVAHSTHQFDRLKPKIEILFNKQVELCNSLIAEARKGLESASPGSDAYDDAVINVVRVRLGMPKNRQLLRLMEDPVIRKAVEKRDMQIHSDSNRGMLQQVKAGLYFAIDERHNNADLTDKGRTLMSPNDPDAYVIPDLVEQMQRIDADPKLDEHARVAAKKLAQQVFEDKNEEMQNIAQLLKAYGLFERDIHYIVDADESGEAKVIIVDEHTGRALSGRRFSEGLHQALEAKEGVRIERETQTWATITIQNYFRLYTKLGGMTGTAVTEAQEFKDIYKLDVVAIPTNRPCTREDKNDRIYKTMKAKYQAIVKEVKEVNAIGRPILIGTPTVEVSEVLSRYLRLEKIPHKVLNARRHREEAEIIAMAGHRGAITIATNMAGRGTDIKLGEGVAEIGGLHVIGATRHDSRRIDRQLRGRCARQGDPGSSVFYISFEDNLMRLFGSDRIGSVMESMGLKDDEQLEHNMLTWVIEDAQKKVENQNFFSRKRTLEYDDVMNMQRNIIYKLRRDILLTEDTRKRLDDIILNTLESKLDEAAFTGRGARGYDHDRLALWLSATVPVDCHLSELSFDGSVPGPVIASKIKDHISAAYDKELGEQPPEYIKESERRAMISAIDELWIDHLRAMDHLRQSVQFTTLAQKDPLIEYKQSAYRLFNYMEAAIADRVMHNMFKGANELRRQRQQFLDMFANSREISADDTELSDLMRQLQSMIQQGLQPTVISNDDLRPEPGHSPASAPQRR